MTPSLCETCAWMREIVTPTVKDGVIEIQGDQRDRLAAVLEGMGYRVKRVGG